jgi:hypothetical protein
VTGGVAIAGVIRDADRLLETEHFPRSCRSSARVPAVRICRPISLGSTWNGT